MKQVILILVLLSPVLFAGCSNDNRENKNEVLEQFDANSPRPGTEEEEQEDSAFVTGTPVQTD